MQDASSAATSPPRSPATKSSAPCRIDWSPMKLATWEELFNRVRRSNLLQHYPYAQANRVLNQMAARHGRVFIADSLAGIVQLAEVGLIGRAIHAVTLDRGPLWFDGFGTPEHVGAFFTTFAAEFPRRIGRKRRVLPEVPDDPAVREDLAALGYVIRPEIGGYDTYWLDLDPDAEMLRKRLDAKWRNHLAKAERGGLAIDVDETLSDPSAFLAAYEKDRTERGYPGPPARMLEALLRFVGPRNEGTILTARQGSATIAAVLIVRHGRSATYLAGWTTPDGRTAAAHNLLLWQATLRLKATGVRDFDLGGINAESAAGILAFKRGMGGELVRTVGFFS